MTVDRQAAVMCAAYPLRGVVLRRLANPAEPAASLLFLELGRGSVTEGKFPLGRKRIRRPVETSTTKGQPALVA